MDCGSAVERGRDRVESQAAPQKPPGRSLLEKLDGVGIPAAEFDDGPHDARGVGRHFGLTIRLAGQKPADRGQWSIHYYYDRAASLRPQAAGHPMVGTEEYDLRAVAPRGMDQRRAFDIEHVQLAGIAETFAANQGHAGVESGQSPEGAVAGFRAAAGQQPLKRIDPVGVVEHGEGCQSRRAGAPQ